MKESLALHISAEAFRIPQILVFNKKDILTKDEREFVDDLIDLYESLSITCLLTSALHERSPSPSRLHAVSWSARPDTGNRPGSGRPP